LHGSTKKSLGHGYRIARVGKPGAVPEDFVTGFLKDGQARGRPVGVAIDRRGALIVADDVGNTVWRVTKS